MFEDYHISKNWQAFEDYCAQQARGLTTGFSEVDRKIIGLPGLVTIQGEPKCCKSTFALQIALNKLSEGTPVIWLDKENGIQRTRLRMLGNIGELTYGAIKGSRDAEEEARYQEAKKKLFSFPIAYHSEIFPEQLEGLIVEAGQKFNKHVLVVVDSLQSLVQNFNDRRGSVDSWIFLFNELKTKYEGDLTILVISEKKRDAYGMASRSGAKESGGIEYKSEMVLDMYLTKDKPAITLECTFNRDGDTGVICNLFKTEPYTYTLTCSEFLPEDL